MVKGYLSKNARNEEFSYTSEAFKTPETIEQKYKNLFSYHLVKIPQ